MTAGLLGGITPAPPENDLVKSGRVFYPSAEQALVLGKNMETYLDIEEFRASEEAVAFVDSWLKAQRNGDVASDYHMNLMAWTSDNPAHVLGIVMNLIDRVEDDETTAEMVAMGPVEWLCENCNDDFVPILREAIRKHAGIATFTRWNRENSNDPCWSRLRIDSSRTA